MVLVKYRLFSYFGLINYELLLILLMEVNNGNWNQKLCVSFCLMEVEVSWLEDCFVFICEEES